MVDNGSTDGSGAIAAEHGARVVPEGRAGYGRALRTGIEEARGDVVVMADADMTYPLNRIPDLVAPIEAGEADMVIGERLSDVARGAMPLLHRYLGTPVLSFLVNRAGTNLRVADSQSGFRAFNRLSVLALGLRSDGMEFASEMLIRSSQRQLRVKSIPTGYRPRAGESKLSTLSDGWRHLQLIALLAPHLFLVWPGVSLFGFGAALTALALISPSGIGVGSLSWQPVFFSGIALVLGLQIALAGAVLAHRSSILNEEIQQRYRFVGQPSFSPRCVGIGASAAAVGLAIDVALFLVYLGGSTAHPRSLAMASLAQSLIIGGTTTAVFGIVNALVDRSSARIRATTP